jgi:hypothetical protein
MKISKLRNIIGGRRYFRFFSSNIFILHVSVLAIFLAVGVAAVLAVIIAPALVVSASAAIRDVSEKNGSIKEGECKGNTDKNGKDDERVNNNDFAPPGQNKDD